MNYYQSLGYLVLGSRLKRLSELFLSEINKSYKAEGIVFETTWFPVFYLLSENKTLTIQELCEQIEVSHPAASQLVTNLKNKGLVISTTSPDDARKQLVTLSEEGKTLLTRILPVWDAITATMEEVAGSSAILDTLTKLETAFKSVDIVKNIQNEIHHPVKSQSNA
ncbi:DNA-binding MarR family transcriptional regulator [Pedobacter cryoconitis]|uniref:MarR family winged helix-turn-helix transcriptional regulator n=1 Tax=Pedobacter cryoconitis TaxID=188932 RepID=UPI00161F6EFF|nr:MarR family winged helix-turn-helix transcriptional regulator [Pedobacter cryoconitis]MBB6270059.1 DNA-binding MarR family transcriptional regulator [Pedobacter cryoconitis]